MLGKYRRNSPRQSPIKKKPIRATGKNSKISFEYFLGDGNIDVYGYWTSHGSNRTLKQPITCTGSLTLSTSFPQEKWGKSSQTTTRNKMSLNRGKSNSREEMNDRQQAARTKQLYMDRMIPPAHRVDLRREGGGSDTGLWFSRKNAFKLACLWTAKNRELVNVRQSELPQGASGVGNLGALTCQLMLSIKQQMTCQINIFHLNYDISPTKVGKMEMPQWESRTLRTQERKAWPQMLSANSPDLKHIHTYI